MDTTGKHWQQLGQICDPRETTGPLQRCPPTETDPNPCRSSNPDWPAHQDVLEALAIDAYDEPNYNSTTIDGFRSFVDANISIRVSDLGVGLSLPVLSTPDPLGTSWLLGQLKPDAAGSSGSPWGDTGGGGGLIGERFLLPLGMSSLTHLDSKLITEAWQNLGWRKTVHNELTPLSKFYLLILSFQR